MNNIFNFNRFGLLLKRQWLDFGKIYVISLLAVIGVVLGFYIWSAPSPSKFNNFDYAGHLDMRFRYPLFIILGFLFISIVASSYFSLLGQKSRAILELMTPASTFEKFLAGVLYTAMLSLACYLVLFYIIDFAFVKYINAHLAEFKMEENSKIAAKPVESIAEQFFNNEKARKFLSGFFALPFLTTSIFLLGSVYFNRFHYIKTAVSVMIFTGLAGYIIFKSTALLSEGMLANNRVNDSEEILSLFLLITTILTFVVWVITFVRLKEKEV